MANTPNVTLVSVVRVYDADTTSTAYIEIITNDSAPDGASDPWSSAPKGSLHIHGGTSGGATDDYSALYQKVDDGVGSDDEWVRFIVDKSAVATSLAAALTMSTDTPLYFRDSGQVIYSSAANVGNIAVGAAADVWRIGAAATNYWEVDYTGQLTPAGSAELDLVGQTIFFDDFNTYQTWVEAETPWILNSGNDAQAIDPAISSAENGVMLLTTGDNDGTAAEDAVQAVYHVPVQADSGGLVVQGRLHINTAITDVSVFVGLTDITTLEEPFTNAADSITSHASDAVGFLFDDGATTKEWWMCAVDGDSDDAGNATSVVAPVADTYQKFRIEIPADGATGILFYINDALVGTFTGSFGVSPDVNLYLTVVACGDGTSSKTVDVDYLSVKHTRS